MWKDNICGELSEREAANSFCWLWSGKSVWSSHMTTIVYWIWLLENNGLKLLGPRKSSVAKNAAIAQQCVLWVWAGKVDAHEP